MFYLRSLLMLFLLTALCALFVLPASAKSHSGTVTITVDLSAHESGRKADLWLPYPVSDKDQTISDVRISGDFARSAVYTDNIYSTPMLYAEWNGEAKSRKLTISFKAESREVIRRDFPKRDAAWDPSDYEQFLTGTSRGPVDGEVKKLSMTITTGKRTVLEKARAVYDWTCENTYRDPLTRGCGEGDVCRLLKKPGGKCADINSLFVSLARAAGVPAREVFGIRLGKKDSEDITSWQHCWAEFYLPGYGWVVVDPADVTKLVLEQKLPERPSSLTSNTISVQSTRTG